MPGKSSPARKFCSDCLTGKGHVRRKTASHVTHRREIPQLLAVNTQVWVDTEMRSGRVNFTSNNVDDESLTLRAHQLALDVPKITRRVGGLWDHDLPKLVRGIGRFLRVKVKGRTSSVFTPLNVDDEVLTRLGHQKALDEI